MCSQADDPTTYDQPHVTRPRAYVLSGDPLPRPEPRNSWLLDDSDSQWLERERDAIRTDAILRHHWYAYDQAEREAIVRLVPPGHWITIVAGRAAKPGTASVALHRLRDGRPVRLAETRGHHLPTLCRSVLGRVVVTTDADGWVESIESVPA